VSFNFDTSSSFKGWEKKILASGWNSSTVLSEVGVHIGDDDVEAGAL
jgi:hypothetical protein